MQLEIINYMCHEYLKIDITGFNILKASNDSGKSAILHAVYELINGGTNNYITKGKDYCKISITDGDNVYSRISDKGKQTVEKNGIVISDTKASFEKIGIKIPLEFFGQHEKIFLLSETPKNRADILNDMFDIENLENGFNNLKKDLKDYKSELIDFENKLSALSSKKTTLEKAKFELGLLKDEYDDTLYKIQLLNKIKERLESKTDLPEKITEDINIDKLELIKEINAKISSKLKVSNLIRLNINNDEIQLLKTIDNKIKSKYIIPDKIDGDVRCDELSLIKTISGLRSNITDLTPLKNELNNIDMKLKGGVCPTCRQQIKMQR